MRIYDLHRLINNAYRLHELEFNEFYLSISVNAVF